MSEKSFLSRDYRIWILINQTLEAMHKARVKHVGKLPYPIQAWALIFIWASGGKATPTSIARYLFEEPHSASELISRMEENGLVRKSRDSRLKSVVRISITDKGREVCTRNMGSTLISELISVLSEKEKKQFEKYLTLILDKACEKLDIKSVLPPEDEED